MNVRTLAEDMEQALAQVPMLDIHTHLNKRAQSCEKTWSLECVRAKAI